MSETKYGGADAHIYTEKYYPPGFVVDNTVLPKCKCDIPIMIVGVGPGRVASTALALLMASQNGIALSYYQPWKTLIRHGLDYGQFCVPELPNGAVFAKETLGPFNEAEQFDPVELLLKAGYPPEKIHPIVFLRDPLAVYKSNLKFEGGIAPQMLVDNILFAHGLYERYLRQGLPAIPFAYELAALGEDAFIPLFGHLGIPFDGLEFDSLAVQPYTSGGKFVPAEAAHPAEWAEIVKPVIDAGKFQYMDSAPIYSENFFDYGNMPGVNMPVEGLVSAARFIDSECSSVYEQFLLASAQYLGLTDKLVKLSCIWGKLA